mmetsp:Transcript_63767/g.137203  ORF Transcript_63767/g.137203 Transcript_63767/m.137203 type:complete len:288 (-) Transcript_63767:69-932(-)
MSRAIYVFLLVVSSCADAGGATNKTIVVTGATGRTGSLTYKALHATGATVRALVRNATKARAVLGCDKCDETEGIFIGDITKGDTLKAAMIGADSLIMTTGMVLSSSGKIIPGYAPKDILFDGVKQQVEAFVESAGPPLAQRHVLLMSMMDTTLPDSGFAKIISKLWGGWDVGFYSLQGEAFLMSAGVPFTILKACGLGEGKSGKNRILAGHDDQSWNPVLNHMLDRGDVAQVFASAAAHPQESQGLRFDCCSSPFGMQQTDMLDVLREAMYPWDPRKAGESVSVVV